MKYMLGTKGRMTQVFDDKGVVSAATIVTAGPLTVTQILGKEKQGYEAVQVGFGAMKESKVNKPQTGKPFRVLRESRREGRDSDPASQASEFPTVGTTIDVSIFAPGDIVAVSAISKGKGFQGVVKRHGFSGGPRSHGQKNKE